MTAFLPRSLGLLALCAAGHTAAGEPPRCQYVQMANLPLMYTGPSLQVTTEGRLNGQPATMLVDTGADMSFLTRTATERLGLTLTTTGSTVGGVGGRAQVYRTKVDEFVAGPARSVKGYVRVLADFGFTPSFDAILGAPFLMQSDVELSLATKELKLFRAKDCEDAFLAYWDQAAQVIPFARNGQRETGNPRFAVRVNGKQLVAMIDSGAGTTSISIDAAKRAGFEPDAPDAGQASKASGVGKTRVAVWHMQFKRFEMGGEVIDNPDIAVLDHEHPDVDMILGDDFLRAHRVLFAMSQQKLYFSYIGGPPFGQWRTLEPWMRAEADAGNPDAQMMLSNAYKAGKWMPRNEALAAEWLEKAVRAGSPRSYIASGRQLMQAGQVAQGAQRLRAGLDKLPSHRNGALWLYLARLRTGEPERAKTELAAAQARNDDMEWPGPIGELYLGKIDAPALLALAAADATQAEKRRCQALGAIEEWHQARGEAALAATAKAQAGSCASMDEDS
jgi:predicted aspartyl protease